jgi:protein SCO1/2
MHRQSSSNNKTFSLTDILPAIAGLFVMAASISATAAVQEEDPHAHHQHMMQQSSSTQEADPHAHHKHMMEQKGYRRSTHNYEIPQLELVDMNNNTVSLTEALNSDEPVMLNFIFTTCTTICPVLSATFSQVQRELGPEAKNVRMISVTIDPEQDTPAQLKKYAARFKAEAGWQFLTGDLADIIATQKAFDAYRGDKMSHEPLTFLRRTPADPWVRLEGFASASEVVAEYRMLETK